jgi:NhaP-type Na+/H+ or K+/H+ antiporter
MKYKNIIKLLLPEIQLLAAAPKQLKFNIVKDHDEPTILLYETLFCMWECFNMGTELPTKVMLGQTLVLMQMAFLNNVRKVGRLILSRTSCLSVNTDVVEYKKNMKF